VRFGKFKEKFRLKAVQIILEAIVHHENLGLVQQTM